MFPDGTERAFTLVVLASGFIAFWISVLEVLQ